MDGFSFKWGSSPENVHSGNIRRDSRVFAVVFDSNAPEGMGEGVYMQGRAYELEEREGAVAMYRFVPERAWINDEAKNDDDSYKHDIRIELDLEQLKKSLDSR